ncbi:hypothetical protein Tco_0766765 [Tanacetum coccineum]
MGEPLSPDCVFDFPVDELELHPAYDFFAPASLPGYAGNLNNNNEWLEADDYLLGELEAMVDEQMVIPAIEEVTEPVAEVEEEQVITPAVDIDEGQMDVPVIDMEEDLAVLLGDGDFEDDASDGFGEAEVWEVNEDWLMAPTTTTLFLGLPIPPFVIKDLSTRLEVSAGVTIGELGPRVYAAKGQIQVIASQMVHAADRWEQIGAQVEQGQQTTFTKMGSRESTLMRCILGLESRIAALKRRPPGPQ